MKSDKEYFDHILEEIEFILKQSNIDKEYFKNNDLLKRAFARSIEIIGEAVKNISQELKRKYPDVEWRKIAATRDRIIHGYFAIDYDILWDIVSNKIPEIKIQIEKITNNEDFLF